MWWSRLRTWTPTILLLATFAAAVPLWLSIRETAESIKTSVTRQDAYFRASDDIKKRGNPHMSYSKVVVRVGGPNGEIVATYENVTDYVEHDDYISFNYPGGHVSLPGGQYWIHCE